MCTVHTWNGLGSVQSICENSLELRSKSATTRARARSRTSGDRGSVLHVTMRETASFVSLDAAMNSCDFISRTIRVMYDRIASFAFRFGDCVWSIMNLHSSVNCTDAGYVRLQRVRTQRACKSRLIQNACKSKWREEAHRRRSRKRLMRVAIEGRGSVPSLISTRASICCRKSANSSR